MCPEQGNGKYTRALHTSRKLIGSPYRYAKAEYLKPDA